MFFLLVCPGQGLLELISDLQGGMLFYFFDDATNKHVALLLPLLNANSAGVENVLVVASENVLYLLDLVPIMLLVLLLLTNG